MKTVLQHILTRKRDYARLPLFDFLRDDRLSARERLGFFPCMAPFIMSFGDLNRHVLRIEPSSDPLQQMLNAHSHEDDHHWPWYLEDLKKLGHDKRSTPSDVLRFLFSDASVCSRMLAHRLANLVWNAKPAVRLAIVEAIEETGNVLFALTSKLALAIERDEGILLRYLGEFHFRLESGHAMNNDHAVLAQIALDDATRAQALEAADLVFGWFEGWTDELLRFAMAARSPLHDTWAAPATMVTPQPPAASGGAPAMR